MVPIKCDVHGIKGVPPGNYTIEAWHERLGPMGQKVALVSPAPDPTLVLLFEHVGGMKVEP